MYREEFTRKWYEDQFPRQDHRQQYSGNSWRDKLTGGSSQFKENIPGQNIYLSDGVPLPIQHESELHGRPLRRNPVFNDNAETSFIGNEYRRGSVVASENLGIANRAYLGDAGKRWDRRPYETSSAIADPRSEPMFVYKGRTPSEPGGFRPSNWERNQRRHNVNAINREREHRRFPSGDSSTGVYSNAPSWVKSLEPMYTEPNKAIHDSYRSKNKAPKTEQTSLCGFITIRAIIICLVIWDLVNDWLLSSVGPIQFLGTASDKKGQPCEGNYKVMNRTFKMNVSNINTSMCSKTNDIWTLAAVFSLLGSLLAVLQVINIVMEIVKRRRPHFFQILQGHSEVCFVMFFEELPQCLLFTIYFFICDCQNLQTNVNLYSLLGAISASTAMTLRYASSFNGFSNDDGCCNLWWRCCCCRNNDYMCRLQGKECCCTCDMPCPLCCCTLHCYTCRYTPRTWCASLLKAFSCFCGCCSSEDDSYGVRMMNNFSLLILWVCLAFQIVIFYSVSLY